MGPGDVGYRALDILDTLAECGGPMDTRALADDLGATPRNVGQSLVALFRNGQVEQVAPHYGNQPAIWRITDAGRESLDEALLRGRHPGVRSGEAPEEVLRRSHVEMLRRGGEIRPKLTEGDVRLIRQMYNGGDGLYSQVELGRRFGISHVMVGKIVRWESWAHVQ